MFVIAGVTGHTGSAAATALLDAKKPVRVIVRSEAKGRAWRDRGAEVAIADFNDAKGLARAIEGATGAYLLLPPFGFTDTGLAESRARTGQALVEAARLARPKHVVFLSSIGAQHASGTGPIAALHPVEKGLAVERIPSTFLRAAYFAENWGASLGAALEGGVLYTGLASGKKIPMVATVDIGRVAAELLQDPIASGTRIVELAGPEDATIEDVAATLARASGKSVRAQQVPIPAVVQSLTGLGASTEVANLYAELTQGVNEGRVAWSNAKDVVVRRGTTSVQAVLRGLLPS